MNQRELLAKIKEAARTNATKLYLGGNKLTSLPPEIGSLASLKTLNLDNNELTSGGISILPFMFKSCCNRSRNSLVIGVIFTNHKL